MYFNILTSRSTGLYSFVHVLSILMWTISLLYAPKAQAQEKTTIFSALVVNEGDEPLIGATVNWKDTTIGAITDIDGWFSIERVDTINAYFLEISYVGYQKVEVEILPEENQLKLIVKENATIEDIIVETRNRANFTSTLDPLNIETIAEGELRRAACCNLSESFENNATVNVSFTDAITGAKEIEMLGLRGTYTQMMVENRPAFNRLGRAYGLEYIPGTFIAGIQISKGASSVKNGVQGITGQINTELIKPYKAPLLFVNFFGNYTGRLELNLQLNYRLTEHWSTGLLVHGNYYGSEFDYNKDAFLDIPLKKQANVLSRWMYKTDMLHFECNIHGIWDSRNGGQTNRLHHAVFDSTANRLYQVNSEIRRIGVFGKLGYFGFDNPSQSIAILYDANIHQHNSIFGSRLYNALQKRIYTNFIFQTSLFNKNNTLVTGLTYDLIDFEEQFSDINNDRTEHNASVYAEYDFTKKFDEDKGNEFSLILGVRGDLIHTQQFTKIYPSPRINIKYNFTSDIVLRASAGRGVRNPNLFIENLKYMPSYRNFVVLETILPEVAWNYGLNFVWNFNISPKLGGNLSIDLYRTDFENQLLADIDSDPNYTSIQFYNLKGQSYANSFLLSYTQDIVKGLEARIAYKFNDVWMTFGNVLHDMPLMPRHRGLVHLNYTTPKKDWEFNITMNIVGPQRLPHLHPPYGPDLPIYRLQGEYSPTYVLLNAHINKTFKGGWEVYIGAENLTNYTQEQPILGFQDPFGQSNTVEYANFDAASVFAPVFGVQVYAGVKYTFKGKERFPPPSSCSNTNSEVAVQDNNFEMDDELHYKIIIKSSVQCGTCVQNINNGLRSLDGIEDIQVDLHTQLIEIIYNKHKTNIAALKNAIVMSGYDADHQVSNSTAYNNLPACCKKDGGHRTSPSQVQIVTDTIKSSIQCGMCRQKISDKLYKLNGFKNVIVDLDAQLIVVQYLKGKTTLIAIKKLINQIGYDADDMKAKQSVYNKLPACCKKPEDR